MSRADRRRSAEHGFMACVRSAEHAFTPSVRSAEHGFTPFVRSAEHGFTLVEMLVALAVFGLAALALLRLEGATLRNAAILQDRLIGQIVARNVAVEALTDPQPPAYGATVGMETDAGRSWRWTRNTLHAPDPGLQRIDILVTDDSGHAAGTLTIFRAAPL